MRKIPSSRLPSAGCHYAWCQKRWERLWTQKRMGWITTRWGQQGTELACSEQSSKNTQTRLIRSISPNSSRKTLRQACIWKKKQIIRASVMISYAYDQIIMHLGVDQTGSWVSRQHLIWTIQHVDVWSFEATHSIHSVLSSRRTPVSNSSPDRSKTLQSSRWVPTGRTGYVEIH